jgi:hypothetical protein
VTTTRTDRAAQLVVARLADGDRERWRVRDPASGSEHLVERDHYTGELHCDRECQGFRYRAGCRHVDAVTRFENGEPPDGVSTDPGAAKSVNDAGPGLERDVPPPECEP